MQKKEAYTQTVSNLKRYLRTDRSFDVMAHGFEIGGRDATIFFVNGFAKDEILQRLLNYIMSLSARELKNIADANEFEQRYMTYIQVGAATDMQKIATQVLSGFSALVVEGIDGVVMIEARTYPTRSVDEPGTDRVMRGSHDGFVETLFRRRHRIG